MRQIVHSELGEGVSVTLLARALASSPFVSSAQEPEPSEADEATDYEDLFGDEFEEPASEDPEAEAPQKESAETGDEAPPEGEPEVEDAAAPRPGIENITVTARRREELLQDVPTAVTALDQAELQAATISRIDEIAKFVPNVKFDAVTGSKNRPPSRAPPERRPERPARPPSISCPCAPPGPSAPSSAAPRSWSPGRSHWPPARE